MRSFLSLLITLSLLVVGEAGLFSNKKRKEEEDAAKRDIGMGEFLG